MPNANAIHERVTHFKQKWPPFHHLKEEQLRALSEKISIRFAEKDETLIKEGENPTSHFYLVKQGSVKITTGSDNKLIDICDENQSIRDVAQQMSRAAVGSVITNIFKTSQTEWLIHWRAYQHLLCNLPLEKRIKKQSRLKLTRLPVRS